MWSLIEIIREHEDKPRNFSEMIWTHAVVTPTARFSYESPEYQGWKLCDSNELNKKSLSTFLLNAIEEQLKKDLPNRNYIDNNACNPTNIVKCLEILKPEGESILETPEQRESRILKEINEILTEAVQVAEKGMLSTKDLLATKGRASFLGERAKGHIDPGARSSQLMIKTVCESVIQK